MAWFECTGGGGSVIPENPQELFCLACVGNDAAEIPQVDNLAIYGDFADYLVFNTTTRKFEVIQDFTAILVPWVYNYETAKGSYSKGRLIINDTVISAYVVSSRQIGEKAGDMVLVELEVGDEFWVYTPNDDGYPQQFIKGYFVAMTNADDIVAFADEGANS